MTRSVPSPKTFLLLVKVGPLARSSQALPEPQAAGLPVQGPTCHCCPPPQLQGEQADGARYSVTQVTVEARATAGSPPRFPVSLYHGTVAVGSGVGVAVQDAAVPSQPLRIRAQDPEFPVGPAWPALGGGVRVMGAARALRSPALCPGPQLSHHVQSHQQLRLPHGRGGRADGRPAAAGGGLLRRGEGWAAPPGAGGKGGPRRDKPPSCPRLRPTTR